MTKLLSITLLLVAFSCAATEVTSFVNLLTTPEKFDSKCVQTVGVISVEFEGSKLYLNNESYTARVYENAIRHSLYFSEENDQLDLFAKRIEGKLVRVVGLFKYGGDDVGPKSSIGFFESINYLRTLDPKERIFGFGEKLECQ